MFLKWLDRDAFSVYRKHIFKHAFYDVFLFFYTSVLEILTCDVDNSKQKFENATNMNP